MSNSFTQKKEKILDAINVSHMEYSDLSPKGSIDEGIREAINLLNSIPGLVTTSSCAGRVSVYVDGLKKNTEEHRENGTTGGSGGKGGGRWIFVSHDPVNLETNEWSGALLSKFEMHPSNGADMPIGAGLVHLKFESMILHVLAATIQDASSLLTAAFESGFRESGAMNLPASANNESSLMVGIRSMGVSFDSIIGYRDHSGQLRSVVDEKYVYNMFLVANERFKINFERTKRFQMNVSRIFSNTTTAEERGTRKQRKRAEGLATQHRLRRIIDSEETHDEDDHTAIRDLWD